MKYWWLKRYKGLKIKLIPELIRDVNTYFVLPKNYKDRYDVIKDSDISHLSEEDLRILLAGILNHEKIKNNKVILIIDALLKIPDNSMPETNYTLSEMLEEIGHLKEYDEESKLSTNNIAACYHCLQVFYIDAIKYVNKKGQCLCPFCRRATLYFDNDFVPMDHNFLRLAKLFYENTPLGCNYGNIQKLLRKCVKLKEGNPTSFVQADAAFLSVGKEQFFSLTPDYVQFSLAPLTYKKAITSKEEFQVEYQLNECFSMIEKNLISKVVIDMAFVSSNKSNSFNFSVLLTVLENLGRNPYLKEIVLVAANKRQYQILKNMVKDLLKPCGVH